MNDEPIERTQCAACGRRDPEPILCRTCASTVLAALCDLPRLFILSGLQLRSIQSGMGGPRSAPGSKPPMSSDLLSWRVGTDLLGALGSWERLVREDRQLAPIGALPPMGSAEHELLRVVRFLAAHHGWLCENASPQDWAAEVLDLHRAAMHYGGQTEPRAMHVPCVCGYTLRMAPGAPSATCGGCGAVRAASGLALAALDDPWAAEQWVDLDDAHTITGIPGATIRSWARKGAIRRDADRYGLRSIVRHQQRAADNQATPGDGTC